MSEVLEWLTSWIWEWDPPFFPWRLSVDWVALGIALLVSLIVTVRQRAASTVARRSRQGS